MQDSEKLLLISKHLSGKETAEENIYFLNWLKERERNLSDFEEIKKVIGRKEEASFSFFKSLTKAKVADVLLQHVLGNVIGFAIGLWVTNSFTHYITEKRGMKNLFGMAGRKKIIVNETPEWVQYCLSFILGFIALELINYFFKTKKYIPIINFIKNKLKK